MSFALELFTGVIDRSLFGSLFEPGANGSARRKVVKAEISPRQHFSEQNNLAGVH